MIKQVSNLHKAVPAPGDSRYLCVLAFSCSIGCQRHWYTAIRPNGLYSAGSPNSKRKWSPGGALLQGKGNEWTDVWGQRVNTYTAIASYSCSCDLSQPSTCLASSFTTPLSPSLTLSPHPLSLFIISPPTDSSQFLHLSALHRSALYSSPFLRIMHRLAFILQFPLFPLLYFSTLSFSFLCLCLCLLSSVSLPLSPALSSSGQENDYAKQDWDPSMCHQLVPQVPSEGQPTPPPSSGPTTMH